MKRARGLLCYGPTVTKLIMLVSINKHDGQKPTSLCKYSGKLNQRQLIYLVANLPLNTEDEN
jgi:hypothetical protein